MTRKTEYINVRFTKEEKNAIKDKCKKMGYENVSMCIRRIIREFLYN